VKKILVCMLILTLFSSVFAIADGPATFLIEPESSYEINEPIIIPIYIESSDGGYPFSIYLPDVSIENDNSNILDFNVATYDDPEGYKTYADAISSTKFTYTGGAGLFELNVKKSLFSLQITPSNPGEVKLSLNGNYFGEDDSENEITLQEVFVNVVDCLSDSDDDGNDLIGCQEPVCNGKIINEETCCQSHSECYDENIYTIDYCGNNICQHVNNVCKEGDDIEGKSCVCDAPLENVNGVCSTACDSDTDCNDNLLCTQDTCIAGACSNEEIENCCYDDTNCNDGNICSSDSCDLETNQCVFEDNEGCCNIVEDCNDNNLCTEDQCANHACRNPFWSDEALLDPYLSVCCNEISDCGDSQICSTGKCFDVSQDCIDDCNIDFEDCEEDKDSCEESLSSCLDDCVTDIDIDGDGISDESEPENCVVVGLHNQEGVYVYPLSYATHAGCQKGDLNKNGCINLPDWGMFLSLISDHFEDTDYEGPGDLSGKNGLDLADWGMFLSTIADHFTEC
jgi:hypothetical protein